MLQYLMTFGTLAKIKLYSLLTDEEGDVNVVSIVVLIGIAVLLAIIFKKQISALIGTLLNGISNNAKNALEITE